MGPQNNPSEAHRILCIIVNWNKRLLLLKGLDRILNKVRVPPGYALDVLVVDNNSSDGSREAVADRFKAVTILEPGDVILAMIRGELSNLFIPGDWKHAAIFYGFLDEDRPTIIEAIGQGVIEKDLMSFMFRKDRVAIFRPRFASVRQKLAACAQARACVGRPYDYEFRGDNRAYYCAELVVSAYAEAMGGECPMEPWDRDGNLTVLPQDIAKAVDKWDKIWESGKALKT